MPECEVENTVFFIFEQFVIVSMEYLCMTTSARMQEIPLADE